MVQRRENIVENFNRMSRVHERYRQTTDDDDDKRICDSIYSIVAYSYVRVKSGILSFAR